MAKNNVNFITFNQVLAVILNLDEKRLYLVLINTINILGIDEISLVVIILILYVFQGKTLIPTASVAQQNGHPEIRWRGYNCLTTTVLNII